MPPRYSINEYEKPVFSDLFALVIDSVEALSALNNKYKVYYFCSLNIKNKSVKKIDYKEKHIEYIRIGKRKAIPTVIFDLPQNYIPRLKIASEQLFNGKLQVYPMLEIENREYCLDNKRLNRFKDGSIESMYKTPLDSLALRIFNDEEAESKGYYMINKISKF